MRAIIFLLLVHSWYDKSCCADKDCHPVPCSEIHNIANGDFVWQHGLTEVYFNHNVMKVSEDGECHVCVQDPPTSGERGICIYLPVRS